MLSLAARKNNLECCAANLMRTDYYLGKRHVHRRKILLRLELPCEGSSMKSKERSSKAWTSSTIV